MGPIFVKSSPGIGGDELVGKDAVGEGFRMFDKSLPNLKEQVINIVAESDRVACQVVETATFTGSYANAYGSGKPDEPIL